MTYDYTTTYDSTTTSLLKGIFFCLLGKIKQDWRQTKLNKIDGK